MRTAVEMLQYAKANNLERSCGSSVKVFKLIEGALAPGEEVEMAFNPTDGLVIVFTNKNLMVAKKAFLDTYVHSYSLDEITNVDVELGFLESKIKVETAERLISISYDKKIIKEFHPKIVAHLDNCKKQKQRGANGSKGSLVDELERLADLVERGAITKEEFEAFKKKLLNS